MRPTDDQVDTIVSYVRGGADVLSAASQTGLDAVEFDQWLRKPRQKALRGRVERALAQADLTDLSIITSAANTRADAASGTWHAAKARMDLRRESERERHLLRLRELTRD